MADPRSASELFAAIKRPVPAGLADRLCRAYVEQQPEAQVFEITQLNVIFVWTWWLSGLRWCTGCRLSQERV